MDNQSLAKESIRYFVGRINTETEVEEVVHTNQFSGLFTTSEDFEQSRGFSNVQTANKIANFLNGIENEVATYNERKAKYHYFTYRKDDKVSHLANYKRDNATENETKSE